MVLSHREEELPADEFSLRATGIKEFVVIGIDLFECGVRLHFQLLRTEFCIDAIVNFVEPFWQIIRIDW